ncbi:MAG: acetate/propionate family kinase [Nanoarchaeota archaeon]
MKKRVLVFNVGSSSIKYSLFDGGNLIDSEYFERLKKREDYSNVIKRIFEKIDKKSINLIAHRIVHGGDLNKPVKINNKVKEKIKEFSEFAPLHNPKELMVIELCERYNISQYAVFDTMFFSGISEKTKIYAIPKEITKKYKIRRYGFHGLSHEFVSKDLKGRTIVCHLGSGASVSAIFNGNAIDTSMGLTPLEGLVMGTRSGNIDPGIVIFLQRKGFDIEKVLSKRSGLKGLCGYNDFRDILKRLSERDCKLAYDIFVYNLVKIVGSYLGSLSGLDNLVFTGAIGENVAKLRKDVCDCFGFLGLRLNKDKNKINAEIISSENSDVKVYVTKTDESKMILDKTLKIL